MEAKRINEEVFDLFRNKWALVTAGTMEKFNTCTVGWGAMGSLWTRKTPGLGNMVTVYLHPARYTTKFMMDSEYFTVSFYDQKYKKDMGILGAKSGRDCDKVALTNLTPVEAGESMSFKQAETTFVCRKMYQHKFTKKDMNKEICEYYKSRPESYPLDENGIWQPHLMFIGEVVEVIEQEG